MVERDAGLVQKGNDKMSEEIKAPETEEVKTPENTETMQDYAKELEESYKVMGDGEYDTDTLLAWQKMLCQIVVTAIFAVYLVRTEIPLTMLIPFSGGKYLNIGWIAIPVLFLAVIGTVNGVNFTDGLDGLASSVTVLVATFFTVVAIGTSAGIAPITCAVVGALLGFLLFNVYPASVFMGDTGSLALGGFVASTAYMLQMPIFILIVGLIYWIEIISVMIQVTYFKKTGGKRFFRMAPIHHHFELGGWSETRVVAVFSIVTALLCLVAFIGM